MVTYRTQNLLKLLLGSGQLAKVSYCQTFRAIREDQINRKLFANIQTFFLPYLLCFAEAKAFYVLISKAVLKFELPTCYITSPSLAGKKLSLIGSSNSIYLPICLAVSEKSYLYTKLRIEIANSSLYVHVYE